MKRLRVDSIENNRKKIKLDKINKIESINDLIKIGKLYNEKKLEYNGINLRILNSLINPLEQLNNIIGLHDAKKQIISHILYLSRGLGCEKCNTCIDCVNNIPCVSEKKDKFHTVIYGPPGVGKTTFAKILGKIYATFNEFNDELKIVSRSDLISGYMGRTAKKTQKIINSCENGILFIDEAYSLGADSVDTDTYSKECIDTLNLNLMEKNFICIIAGYKNELEKCFFSKNPGLSRRFTFIYNLNGYTSDELYQIMIKKINDIKWFIDDKDFLKNFIDQKYLSFDSFGGSIESFLIHIKIEHSLNLNSPNKHISKDDILNGFESYIRNKK
jgi:hypothetical protein